jgi:hypothetical protein
MDVEAGKERQESRTQAGGLLMRERKVFKDANLIVSETTETIDNTTKDGGKLEKVNIFRMDRKEAERQLKWVNKEFDNAKQQYNQAKHNMTPEGRKNLMFLEKQKAQQIREYLDELKDLKEQYESVL